MLNLKIERWRLRCAPREDIVKAGAGYLKVESRAILSVLAVIAILASIGTSTLLALRQAKEQNSALLSLNKSGQLKHDLNSLQQMLLDQHGELYAFVRASSLEKRQSFAFPLRAIFDVTKDARASCRLRQTCYSQFDDLDGLLDLLAERSDALAARLSHRLGTVETDGGDLTEIDAYFYSALENVVQIRSQVDAAVDTAVNRSTGDAERISKALVACGLGASAMLLALIFRNALISRKLRRALSSADSARAKYQRFFDEHPLPIFVSDNVNGAILSANISAQRKFGRSDGELVGIPVCEIWESSGKVDGDGNRDGGVSVGVSRWSEGVRRMQTRRGENLFMEVHHLETEDSGRAATLSVMVDVTLREVAQDELFKSKQTLEYVLDHVPQGIAWKDENLRYVGGNEVFARDAGVGSKSALIGLTDYDLKWSEDPQIVQTEDAQVMAGELAKKHFERVVTTKTGREVWISETKLPLQNHSGSVIGVLQAYEDITNRKKAELAMRLQGRALQASINGIVITEVRDNKHFVMFANEAFERITGYSNDDVFNVEIEALFGVSGEPQKWEVIRHALETNTEANSTLLCIRKSGEQFYNNVLVAPVRDDLGYVTHHVGVMSDGSALVEYQKRLEYQARYDKLTELPNRALLDEGLANAIERALCDGGNVSVLFLDLDRFKEVNDSLGHRVGDALLVLVAKRLKSLVHPNDLVARYGGDEFIIVAERAEVGQLVPTLEQINSAMSEPFQLEEQELYVEASIGISTFPHDGSDADTLIRNADTAMYLAKASGRNGYKFYRPELNVAAAERLKLSTRLRRAVKTKALRIAYQPQVDMRTGRVSGAEALLRWEDEELGRVSPAVFVPVAEETGLIQAIGEWVLRSACRQARAWLDEGLAPVQVSVNVAPAQLERSDLVGTVKSVLAEARLPAEQLELEVTEGALMRNSEDVARVLCELRSLGVKIAIDDFGTGYSSLSYLKRFNVDRIKIDQAFVREIGADEDYEALTRAVIAIANALKFDIIAEGVEREAHRQFLIDHGCTAGQGYLYSPAISSEAFGDMLRKAGEVIV